MDKNDERNISGGVFGNVRDEFAVRSATSGVCWDPSDVPPSFPVYIGVDDQLFIAGAAQQGGPTFNVNLRILGLDGIIHPIQFAALAGSNRNFITQRNQLMEGWLLSCNAIATSALQFGQWMYAVVGLQRAPFGAFQQYTPLLSGYLENTMPISYPVGPVQHPTDGAGYPMLVTQANPAAGADFTITVPNGARWRIISLIGILTTAAAVANRLVTLTYQSGANVFMQSPSNFTQAASIVNAYGWFDSAQYLNTPFNSRTIAPLPSNCFLPRTFTVNSSTNGIQAADQWSGITMLVQEWFENV